MSSHMTRLQTQTYNGWSNRETWVVNLWITSEPEICDMLRHIIKAFDTASEQAEELERCIRQDDTALPGEASMWSDLLTTSLSRVNWHEIIEGNQ